MTVEITFGSVTMMGDDRVPVVGKRHGSIKVQTRDTLLLSGKHSIQANTNYGWRESYSCFGPWASLVALMALIGYRQTLTISGTPAGTLTYANCYIAGDISFQESDNP